MGAGLITGIANKIFPSAQDTFGGAGMDEKKLLKLFTLYDDDNSAALDKEEALQFLGKVYDMLDYKSSSGNTKEQVILLWFENFDADHDGTLDIDEFDAVVKTCLGDGINKAEGAAAKKKARRERDEWNKKKDIIKIYLDGGNKPFVAKEGDIEQDVTLHELIAGMDYAKYKPSGWPKINFKSYLADSSHDPNKYVQIQTVKHLKLLSELPEEFYHEVPMIKKENSTSPVNHTNNNSNNNNNIIYGDDDDYNKKKHRFTLLGTRGKSSSTDGLGVIGSKTGIDFGTSIANIVDFESTTTTIDTKIIYLLSNPVSVILKIGKREENIIDYKLNIDRYTSIEEFIELANKTHTLNITLDYIWVDNIWLPSPKFQKLSHLVTKSQIQDYHSFMSCEHENIIHLLIPEKIQLKVNINEEEHFMETSLYNLLKDVIYQISQEHDINILIRGMAFLYQTSNYFVTIPVIWDNLSGNNQVIPKCFRGYTNVRDPLVENIYLHQCRYFKHQKPKVPTISFIDREDFIEFKFHVAFGNADKYNRKGNKLHLEENIEFAKLAISVLKTWDVEENILGTIRETFFSNIKTNRCKLILYKCFELDTIQNGTTFNPKESCFSHIEIEGCTFEDLKSKMVGNEFYIYCPTPEISNCIFDISSNKDDTIKIHNPCKWYVVPESIQYIVERLTLAFNEENRGSETLTIPNNYCEKAEALVEDEDKVIKKATNYFKIAGERIHVRNITYNDFTTW